jgi:hypothetical protein
MRDLRADARGLSAITPVLGTSCDECLKRQARRWTLKNDEAPGRIAPRCESLTWAYASHVDRLSRVLTALRDPPQAASSRQGAWWSRSSIGPRWPGGHAREIMRSAVALESLRGRARTRRCIRQPGPSRSLTNWPAAARPARPVVAACPGGTARLRASFSWRDASNVPKSVSAETTTRSSCCARTSSRASCRP